MHRKTTNIKSDIENMQENYGGDTDFILLIRDSVTKSVGTAGRECHTAGKILITGSGELMDSFSAGQLKYNPRKMMVLEKGKKLKSRNEEFMLDWASSKGLLPSETSGDIQPSLHQSPGSTIQPASIQILPLAFNPASLLNTPYLQQSVRKEPTKESGSRANLSTPGVDLTKRVRVNQKRGGRKRKPVELISDSDDIPFEDTSADSDCESIEDGINEVNKRRAEKRKLSRIFSEPAPVDDTSSDDSIELDGGCEQRGAGSSLPKKKKKPSKAAVLFCY